MDESELLGIVARTFIQQVYRFQLNPDETGGVAGEIVWDITLAEHLAQQGRVFQTVEIDRAEMVNIAQRNDWTPARVAMVDPALPGLAAPIKVHGQIFYILIDGTHRCVRALREGRPFRARLLDDEAARTACLSCPEGAWPWPEHPAPVAPFRPA